MTPEFTEALMRTTFEAIEEHWRMQLDTPHVDELQKIKLYEELEACLAKKLLGVARQMGYDFGMMTTSDDRLPNPFDVETAAHDCFLIGVDEARDQIEEGSRGLG